jgi:hypothetical protein
MVATIDDPDDASVEAHFQYRVANDAVADIDADWTDMSSVSDWKAKSGALADNTYDVRVQLSAARADSDWVYERGIIVYYGDGSDVGGGPLTILLDENGAAVRDENGNFATVS